MKQTCILMLHEVGMNDLDLVGGKNASLGEMIQHLTKLGVQIPGGFVITVEAYHEFVRYNNLDEQIRALVGKIDYNSVESLRRAGLQIRGLVRNSALPDELSRAITDAYNALSRIYGQDAT
ncbi:MAG TPA: PEP/pyruvate-binding domain-containing protein, partial [Flavisolibacter sp.]|nr:PEP/pyruvate-binding domain-containing protein [Flavisolibacter sp.]